MKNLENLKKYLGLFWNEILIYWNVLERSLIQTEMKSKFRNQNPALQSFKQKKSFKIIK